MRSAQIVKEDVVNAIKFAATVSDEFADTEYEGVVLSEDPSNVSCKQAMFFSQAVRAPRELE